jgi:hypothetical protein
MTQVSNGWANGNPWHAAGGMRRYNRELQDQARFRQVEILRTLNVEGISLITRGAQARLAERFGVSAATMSRDITAIFSRQPTSRRCPVCRARPLNDEGREAIREGIEQLDRWLAEEAI